MNPVPRLALALLLAFGTGAAFAQPKPDRPQPSQQQQQQGPANGKGVVRLLPRDSVTDHTVVTAQGRLAYTATAGTLAFYDQSGEQSAAVFYVAYVAKDRAPNRPLTFVFNGGPGAASAFLNLGLVGPRHLELGQEAPEAGAKLADNPDTWLAFTDLVLVDPIGTGWSRTVKPDDAKNFWSVRADADAMAKAISLYVTHNDRAGAPLYLLGESYGGFRAAKVANALKRGQGINVDGIVMLSPLLEGWLTFGDDQSALRAALQLPSLAATHLETTSSFTREALAAAEKFALGDYLTTLAGAPLQGAAARAFYERVAKMTGLSIDAVTQARGFVGGGALKTLQKGKVVSRYDATFAVDDPFPEQNGSRGPDPILDGVARAYGGAFAAYARNELGFKTEMTYTLLASDVAGRWDWGGTGRADAGVESDLRVLLAFSPKFRVLIGSGLSDLVTPYAETRYVLDHLPPETPPGRAVLKTYRGGHMVYLDPASRKAFTADAAAFYKASGK
ncbi:MAG TPA: carboxypeptidase [Pseudolabrys sp.]|nr:carboxypeptidase [Pseudolabrys sp.]